MQIQNDDLIRVAKETKLLLGHLDRAVVDRGDLLDGLLKFLGSKLDLRVGHSDGQELLSLLLVLVF